LTLAFAPRLIIQPFRGYHIFQQNPRGHFDPFEFLARYYCRRTISQGFGDC